MLAAAALAFGLVLAGCDAHSKPTIVTPPVTTGSAATTPADAPATDATPTMTGTPSLTPEPTATPSSPIRPNASAPIDTTPIPGNSSLAAQYPDAAAKIPAAVQVVRDFYNGVNHEIDTGDEAPVLKTFQIGACVNCASQVTEIKDMQVNGDTVRGAHLHILSIDQATPLGASTIAVTLTDDQDDGEQLDAKGNLIKAIDAIPPTRLVFIVAIDKSDPVIFDVQSVAE